MPQRLKRPCSQPGCPALVPVGERYCEKHRKEVARRYDQERGTAHERGYTARWRHYSRWFLKQPENVFCRLQLPGCTNLAQCVDHIDPPDGPNDPKFWDPNNHQSACIHCNSVKGRKVIRGDGKPFESILKS
jgi:5-methylcytosine-specific restriction protein A